MKPCSSLSIPWRSNSGNKPSFSKVPSKTKVSENVQFFPCRKNTSNANQVTLILQWNAARIHPLEHMPVLGALQAPQGLQALPWRFQGHRVSGCYQCDHCKSLANLEFIWTWSTSFLHSSSLTGIWVKILYASYLIQIHKLLYFAIDVVFRKKAHPLQRNGYPDLSSIMGSGHIVSRCLLSPPLISKPTR